MTCDKCHQETDGLILGFPEQDGAAWCVPCVRAAGINLPTVLASRYSSDDPVADRAAWLARKAEAKRTSIAALHEREIAAGLRKPTHKTAPASAPVAMKAPAPTGQVQGLLL